jgi:hypothetical protein
MSLRSLTALLLLLAPSFAGAQEQQQYKNGQDLVGTWYLMATIHSGAPICPAGCVAPALSTIISDGTLVQTAPLAGTGTGHGVWKRTGLRKFKAVALYFRSDPSTGTYVGTSESIIEATVDTSGRQVNGSFTAIIRFADQNIPPVTYTGSIAGTRMELQ